MAATKYHVNSETGDMGICRANIKDCPVSDASMHFSDQKQAVKASEEVLAVIHGNDMRNKRPVQFGRINEKYSHPRADKLTTVDQSVFALRKGPLSGEQLGKVLGFHAREGNYYGDALCYIGLAKAVDGERGGKMYTLNQEGAAYTSMNAAERESTMKEIVGNIPLANTIKQNGKEAAAEYVRKGGRDQSDITVNRKVSCMSSWVQQSSGDSMSFEEVDVDSLDAHIDEVRAEFTERAVEHKPKEIQGEICPKCFLQMPLTGEHECW